MIVHIVMGGIVCEWDCSFLYEDYEWDCFFLCDDGDEPYTFEENQ